MGRFLLLYLVCGVFVFYSMFDVFNEKYKDVGSRSVHMQHDERMAKAVYIVAAICIIAAWPLYFKGIFRR